MFMMPPKVYDANKHLICMVVMAVFMFTLMAVVMLGNCSFQYLNSMWYYINNRFQTFSNCFRTAGKVDNQSVFSNTCSGTRKSCQRGDLRCNRSHFFRKSGNFFI